MSICVGQPFSGLRNGPCMGLKAPVFCLSPHFTTFLFIKIEIWNLIGIYFTSCMTRPSDGRCGGRRGGLGGRGEGEGKGMQLIPLSPPPIFSSPSLLPPPSNPTPSEGRFIQLVFNIKISMYNTSWNADDKLIIYILYLTYRRVFSNHTKQWSRQIEKVPNQYPFMEPPEGLGEFWWLLPVWSRRRRIPSPSQGLPRLSWPKHFDHDSQVCHSSQVCLI